MQQPCNPSPSLTIVLDGQDLCSATALAVAIAEHSAPQQPAQALDFPAGGLPTLSLGPVGNARENTIVAMWFVAEDWMLKQDPVLQNFAELLTLPFLLCLQSCGEAGPFPKHEVADGL